MSARVLRHLIALLPGLVVLLLALLYHTAVPLGEGPDEPGHIDYVLFLAREGRLPLADEVPGEGHQPPLAYLLALPAVAWLPPAEQQLTLSANPHFLWNGGSEAAAFVRSSNEYPPWQGVTLAWHLARWFSTLAALVVVYATWGAARRFFAAVLPASSPASHAEYLGLLAALLVALNPQFLYGASLVSNDMLLAALSAGLLWLCIAALTTGSSGRPVLRFGLPAGLLLGLALLTKQSAVLLAPLLLLVSWQLAGGRWLRLLALTAAWSGVALLVAGWWFGRNWLLYGDPLGLGAFQATYATQPFEWRSPAAWGAALWQLYASFWARFGWLSLQPPAWVLGCYSLLTLLALGGLLWRWRTAGPAAARNLLRGPWALVLLLIGMALAWVVSFALVAGLVAWQGRMLFPALPAIAMVLAYGLAQWPLPIGRRQYTPIFRIIGVTLPLGLLALYLPYGVIAPAYTWHTLPPETAQQRIEQPAYARYARSWEQGIVLRGWHLAEHDADTLNAGDDLTLVLTWHALEHIEHNWTVFVHLVDAEGQIVAEHNSIPQTGAFPLPQWTPGDWVEDRHPLVLPADLPAGEYRLRVGLYLPWQRDPQKGRREQAWDQQGNHIGDFAEVGMLRVR